VSYVSRRKRFLLVTFNFGTKPKMKELEPVFDKGVDWLRYTQNCWLLLTKADPVTWTARLRPLLQVDDRFFIVEVNIKERQGRLPEWMWEWIKKHEADVEPS
jgi:hypothetical protein